MGGFESIVIHHSRKRLTPLDMDRQADKVLKTKANGMMKITLQINNSGHDNCNKHKNPF